MRDATFGKVHKKRKRIVIARSCLGGGGGRGE